MVEEREWAPPPAAAGLEGVHSAAFREAGAEKADPWGPALPVAGTVPLSRS